jgi:Tfp pilus assembly protein PilN
MKQQINLYQPVLRRQEKVFSAMTMLQTICLFLVVLTIIYFYGQHQIKPLQVQLRKLNRDVASLQSQVDSYKNQASPGTGSRLLENEIARLEKDLQERRKVQKILEQQELGNTEGFSGYMEALARQHVRGTWLTRVAIENGGRALSLHGRTLASELVPRYIQRLANEDILSGISFNVMELQRPDAKKEGAVPGRNALEFNISTN